jgi:hypothetical protein
MPRYVTLDTKYAHLASAFGREWATKLFGDEAIASLPVLKAGKNKGAPKGYIIWRKAATTGYCREVCGPLAVGQLADAWIGLGPLSPRSDAIDGKWLGRVQPLAASASAGFFFEDGRARYAAEQARFRQELEAGA